MKEPIELNGITWDHSRAFPPLCATAQRYQELHSGRVRIRWEKRTLHEFGHLPIEEISDRFALIVIDHPWAGYCLNRKTVHDLKTILTDDQWKELEDNCIGPSFQSYHYKDQLLAVPIDAATPAPSWRRDLVEERGIRIPETWSEVVELADRGLAVMPAFPADLFLNFVMLLEALSAEPFRTPDAFAQRPESLEAMGLLKRLSEKMPPEIYESSPIAIAESMTRTDDHLYCPFAYSYSNYARPCFTSAPLSYGNLVTLDDGTPLRSIVGGTGIAIAKRCTDVEIALDYAMFCASEGVQRGIYAYAGGQPARIEAWDDRELDGLSGKFFSESRRTHEQCLMRPRYDGYVAFQERGGIPLQEYLRGEVTRETAFGAIDLEYKRSLSRFGESPGRPEG